MNNKQKLVYWGLLFILIVSACLPIDRETRSINNLKIGVNGPLAINLDDIGMKENGEISITVLPDSQFSFFIENNWLIITFDNPLQVGQEYQVDINTGRKKKTISFTVRYPDLFFIGNANSNPQLWRFSLAEMQSSQITNIAGKVLEVSSAKFGGKVIFLSEDGNRGRKIWQIQTIGNSPELLFECGNYLCSNIACSPTGDRIAFSYIKEDPLLVILNSDGEILNQLPFYASSIHISPDGQWVYFLDNDTNEMVVYGLMSNDFSSYPSEKNLIGSMNENSDKILYGSLDFWGGFPVTAINELSVSSKTSEQLFMGIDDQIEYFNPTFTPGSDWFTISVREKEAGNSTQLWMVDRNGVVVKEITQDYQYSHTALQWSPDMQYLAFQRFKIGESESKPQVVVWNKDDNSMIVVADDAIQPNWLP